MSKTVTILYCREPLSVPKEVADFLERDRKREQAQDRQDTRRLSRSEFETAPSGLGSVRRPVEDTVPRNLQLENLRKAMEELDQEEQNLLALRYDERLTLEKIGTIYRISVSKRLRKLHEALRDSVT